MITSTGALQTSTLYWDYEPEVHEGKSEEKIIQSLNLITDYLNEIVSLNDEALSLATIAINQFEVQSHQIQKKIEGIQLILKEKLSKIEKDKTLEKVYHLFFSKNQAPEFNWIMMGCNDEKIKQIDQEKRKINKDLPKEALTSSIKSQVPLKIIPDAAQSFKLKTYNQEKKLVELQSRTLKENQQDIISQFGYALFQDYIIDFGILFKNKLIQLLNDQHLVEQLETQARGLKADPEIEENEDTKKGSGSLLLKEALLVQTRSTISGLNTIVEKIIQSNAYREEFPQLLLRFIPSQLHQDINPEIKELLRFIFKNYVPEICAAALEQINKLLEEKQLTEKLGNYLDNALQFEGSDYHVELIDLISFGIKNHLTAPAEAICQVLINKLKDAKLNPEFTRLLKNLLIDSFFPKPENIQDSKKHLLIAILTAVSEFLKDLNLSIDRIASHPPTKSQNSIELTGEIMTQQLLSKGRLKIYKKGMNLWEYNLRLKFEEMLGLAFFPNKEKEREATFTQKILIIVIAAFLQNASSSIFNPDTLQILIDRLMTDPLFLNNPFEMETSSKLFDASDKRFSADLDESIKKICIEALKFISDNKLLNFVGSGVLNHLPALGDSIQQTLNMVFNSGVSLIPILIPMQFFFKLNPKIFLPANISKVFLEEVQKSAYQNCYFAALKPETRTPVLKKVFTETDEEKKKRNSRIEREVLFNTQKLEAVLESRLPPFTRNIALKVIQKIYPYTTHEIMMNILLFYLIEGISNGINKGNKAKNGNA